MVVGDVNKLALPSPRHLPLSPRPLAPSMLERELSREALVMRHSLRKLPVRSPPKHEEEEAAVPEGLRVHHEMKRAAAEKAAAAKARAEAEAAAAQVRAEAEVAAKARAEAEARREAEAEAAAAAERERDATARAAALVAAREAERARLAAMASLAAERAAQWERMRADVTRWAPCLSPCLPTPSPVPPAATSSTSPPSHPGTASPSTTAVSRRTADTAASASLATTAVSPSPRPSPLTPPRPRVFKCYLLFSEANGGSFVLQWSDEAQPPHGALASFQPPTPPATWRTTKHDGCSELCRGVGGANVRRFFYAGWASFVRMARAEDACFTHLGQVAQAPVRIYLTDDETRVYSVRVCGPASAAGGVRGDAPDPRHSHQTIARLGSDEWRRTSAVAVTPQGAADYDGNGRRTGLW